jgi:hypothetical protein
MLPYTRCPPLRNLREREGRGKEGEGGRELRREGEGWREGERKKEGGREVEKWNERMGKIKR